MVALLRQVPVPLVQEKCVLGYTLLWNLIVALETEIYAEYCHIKRNGYSLYLRTERSMLGKNN